MSQKPESLLFDELEEVTATMHQHVASQGPWITWVAAEWVVKWFPAFSHRAIGLGMVVGLLKSRDVQVMVSWWYCVASVACRPWSSMLSKGADSVS